MGFSRSGMATWIDLAQERELSDQEGLNIVQVSS
jgi:hypothetical protein